MTQVLLEIRKFQVGPLVELVCLRGCILFRFRVVALRAFVTRGNLHADARTNAGVLLAKDLRHLVDYEGFG